MFFFRQILSRDQIRRTDMDSFTADLIRTSLLTSSNSGVRTDKHIQGNTVLHPGKVNGSTTTAIDNKYQSFELKMPT